MYVNFPQRTHLIGGLPHEEVHPGDEIPNNARNIFLLGIQNIIDLSFLRITKVLTKCGT